MTCLKHVYKFISQPNVATCPTTQSRTVFILAISLLKNMLWNMETTATCIADMLAILPRIQTRFLEF
jgi:hypothetical protein